MLRGTVFHDLDLQPGICVKVTGYIAPDAKHFSINLGKDDLNLGLHFNPRFSAYRETNSLVYTCRDDGHWHGEEKESHFPFVRGKRAEIAITFEKTHFVVKLDDGYQFNYTNHLNFTTINFLAVGGDFKVKTVAFENL